MKRLIIPIFLSNKGCRHRCIFCNQRVSAGGHPETVTEDAMRHIVDCHLKTFHHDSSAAQIAFYGGNFTGMERYEQERLLKYAERFITDDHVDSLRISTRPDCIDGETAAFLKSRKVTTVEIGAQSMSNKVLLNAHRDHTADDTARAVYFLRQHSIEVVLHLMAGLPGDSEQEFLKSVHQMVLLRPDAVRIHPVLVLRDTPLAVLFESGAYLPLALDDAIRWCGKALLCFQQARIPVIRMGLYTTDEMMSDGGIVAGPYHPAFRTLVEGSLFFEMASALIRAAGAANGTIDFFVSSRDVSNLRGYRNTNITKLIKLHHMDSCTMHPTTDQEKGTLVAVCGHDSFITGLSLGKDLSFTVLPCGLAANRHAP